MKLGRDKIVCIVTGLANSIIDQFIIVFRIRVERFGHESFVRENDTGSYIGP